MNRLLTASAIALIAAISTPAFAQYESSSRAGGQRPAPSEDEEQAKPKANDNSIHPSKQAYKAIIDLQKAINANDTANIPAALAAAQAASQTNQDRYLVAQFQLKFAAQTQNPASAAQAVDAIAASGLVDQAKVAQLYRGVGGLYYNSKQYDQAAAMFAKSVALNPNDIETQTLIGEARLAQGNKGEAAAAFERVLQARSAAGQKAPEDIYKRAVQAAYEAKAANAADLARQWVLAYPSAESWHDAVAIYRNLNRQDVEGTIDLLRLLRAAGALNNAGDYALYATSAAEQGNYNEAQKVIDEGIAARKVDPASAQFRDIIPPLKLKPKATAADLAVATKAAKDGTALLRIGDRYYALGDYAKAVELYRMAQGKPGVDADVANLHIGMALAASGDKAGATAALKAVSGGRAPIAQYWLLYVQSRA
jgi:tetratricopeptide (TPR) repeat protein